MRQDNGGGGFEKRDWMRDKTLLCLVNERKKTSILTHNMTRGRGHAMFLRRFPNIIKSREKGSKLAPGQSKPSIKWVFAA